MSNYKMNRNIMMGVGNKMQDVPTNYSYQSHDLYIDFNGVKGISQYYAKGFISIIEQLLHQRRYGL